MSAEPKGPMTERGPAPGVQAAGRFRPFVNVFVPFALLLTAGNLDAETGLLGVNPAAGANPTRARVVYSIWLAFAFAAPALVLFGLFDLRRAPPAVYRYWQLFWAFGFLAYLVHSYYAVGVWFGWDFDQIAERQTWPVAVTNYLLLAVWGLDVLVGLVGGQRAESTSYYRFQWFTHLLLVAAVYTSSIRFHSPAKSVLGEVLGWLVIAGFALALLIRLVWGDTSAWCRSPRPGPAAPTSPAPAGTRSLARPL